MNTLLVIFGITGDLSTRKLLPALTHIIAEAKTDFTVLGVSRREVEVAELIQSSTGSDALTSSTEVLTMDVSKLDDYKVLKDTITATGADQTLIYLSVPPGAAAQIVDLLGEAEINDDNIKILFEKPFGFDLESAHDFIARTSRFFTEKQIYRVDHYMAKEISAEILRLRRNAATHHHTWGAESIKAINIIASEKIGIEGRAQFYEQTGALRDFVQGHLMQLLSLVLLDATSGQPLPLQRLAALASVELAGPDAAIRAQYEGYQEEVGNIGSTTETFAALKLRSTDPKWEGVDIQILSGKALDSKRSYIEIVYKDGTTDVFEEGDIQPVEGHTQLDAYERVLLEAIKGNKDLFTTSPEIIRSWEIVTPAQKQWGMDAHISKYHIGSKYTDVL